MDPLHATIEEFATEGYTQVECFCPRCRVISMGPMSWLPKISMSLAIFLSFLLGVQATQVPRERQRQ